MNTQSNPAQNSEQPTQKLTPDFSHRLAFTSWSNEIDAWLIAQADSRGEYAHSKNQQV